jgi:UDP-N-acetylglucosamine:LPS N-acetylglucosamine transferase
LADKAISLVQDSEKKLELTRNIGKMARPNAADDIALEVLKLAS